MDWFKGKKTYIVAVATVAMGAAQAFGVVIPEVIWPIFAALGMTTLRAGVEKQTKIFDNSK